LRKKIFERVKTFFEENGKISRSKNLLCSKRRKNKRKGKINFEGKRKYSLKKRRTQNPKHKTQHVHNPKPNTFITQHTYEASISIMAAI
jgi:hypothetical protein